MSEKLSKENKIKFCIFSTIFFFFFSMFKTKRQKNNKNILDDNEYKNTPSMYGKIKPNLRERGLDIPRQKSNSLMCFFYHPQIVSAVVSQDNKRKHRG
jgi:hypothetical protein